MLEVVFQIVFEILIYGFVGGVGRYIYGDENQSGFAMVRLGLRLFVFFGAAFLGGGCLGFMPTGNWAFLIGIPWFLCFAIFLYYEKTRGSFALWIAGLVSGLVLAALALS